MFPSNISNSTNSLSEEAAAASAISSAVTRVHHHDFTTFNPMLPNFSSDHHPINKIKKKRNLPGNPDPDAEVIALSPKTLMATNRFVCEICNKGFQRDQNLQLHRRGHNLPWKLKQRNSKDMIKKRVYVCPEITCVHHHPSRALGDLTGIKKHFCRKHGEKKWKCEKCSKIYAVQSDWKAHSKTCGTREYRCDCGTLFSRKDSFVTHRAFCDALAEESARLSSSSSNPPQTHISPLHWDPPQHLNPNHHIKPETTLNAFSTPPPFHNLHVSTTATTPPTPSHAAATPAHLSATALLQKAGSFGSQPVGHVPCTMSRFDMGRMGFTTGHVISPEYMGGFGSAGSVASWQKNDRLTRDFMGLTGDEVDNNNDGGRNVDVDVNVNVSVNVRNLLSFTGGVEFSAYGFSEPVSETWRNC